MAEGRTVDKRASMAQLVDYRLPGGLAVDEIGDLPRALLASDKTVGMDVAIFNPALDPDGAAARALVEVLVYALG